MPPYRDPNRLFYDPVNPVMLSPEQMQQLSPQELQAATDQLDQHLVLILQQIEENFAKCNQVVVEDLLPAVEQHGENSMRIYESIKFWRPFFEAAASIRLHEPYADDSASIATEEENRQTSLSPDRTVSSVGDQTYSSRQSIGSEVEDLEGTPKASSKGVRRHHQNDHDLSNASSSLPPEPHWSTDNNNNDQFASPFLSSNQPLPANSAMKQPSNAIVPDQQLQRLRLRDLPPDSPDVPEPEFETAVFGGGGGTKGKGRDHDLSIDSTNGGSSPSFSLLQHRSESVPSTSSRNDFISSPRAAIRAGGGDKAHSKLLDKILRKNLGGSPVTSHRAGPGSSTPGRPLAARSGGGGGAGKQVFPPDLPREWNGIANLSQTNLDSFPSPIKRRQSLASTIAGGEVEEEEGERGEDSFVQMMAAAVPTRSTSSYLTSSPAPPPLPKPSSHHHQSTRAPPPSSSAFSTSPSKLTRTPAKFAAKLTARNVYESLGLDKLGEDSPILSPPGSLLKTNHKPFNLYEHTIQQEQENQLRRLSMSLGAGGGGGGGEGEEEEEDHEASPTTDRRSRIIHASSTTTTKGGEISFNSSSNQSYQPSFLGGGDRDISHTQPFDLYQYQQQQQRSVKKGHQGQSVEEEENVDDIDDILLGGKTMTFNQERKQFPAAAAFSDLDLGGIVDDDDQEHLDGNREGRTESTGTQRYQQEEEEELSYVDEPERGDQEGIYHHHHQYAEEEDESFNIERGLRGVGGGGGFGNKLLDGPEDTLFGMPQQPPQQSSHQVVSQRAYEQQVEEEEDTFTQTQEHGGEEPLGSKRAQTGGSRNGAGFRLHGLSEMETLHGGELLSSEPFQASPLAGRWGH
ncbi:hypothetical protein JCM3765_001122 [Sporobolomyces pararoseus]